MIPRPDIPVRPDVSTDPRIRRAALVLSVFGVFLLVGLPLGVLGVVAAGEPYLLMGPRIAASYLGLAAAGAGLMVTARALKMRFRWGRRVGLLSLSTICILCVVMGGAAIVLPGEGDGAGYVLLGAIELLGARSLASSTS